MMKKYFLFISFLLTLLVATSCIDEIPKPFVFASSIPEDYVFGKLENDTTVSFIVNSDDDWTATVSADWCALSTTTGFQKTTVRMTIKRNLSELLRSTEISFKFKNSTETKKLLIRQFGSSGELVFDVNALELSSIQQDTSVVVLCNMPLDKTVEYVNGTNWIAIGETVEISPYKYKVKFSTTSENSGTDIRKAKLVFSAKNSKNEEFKKEIAINQMYYTLPISYTLLAGDEFKIKWSTVADINVQYYAIRVYDANFALLDSINVTNLTEYDLSKLPSLNSTTPYLGAMSVEVVGKENETATILKAKTPKSFVHSQFLSGDGTAAKPYALACYRHLVNMQKMNTLYPLTTKCYYILNNDIVLNDPMMTNGLGANFYLQTTFSGTFDGNGYALKNVCITSENAQVAPFSTLSKGGVIKNLTVYVGLIKSTKAAVTAGLVGLHYGRIINCFVKPNSSSSLIFSDSPMQSNGVNFYVVDAYLGFAGGISGSLEGSIVGCGNYCPIVTAVVAGGITGGCQNNSSVTGEVINCFNTATIYHGNPIGVILPAGVKVTSAKIGTHPGVGVGGIIGTSSPMSEGVKVARSYNTGDLKASSGCVGGICGRSFALSIEDCYNTGVVSCKKATATNVNIGGIVGLQNGVFNKSYRTYNVGALEYDQYTTLGMMVGQVGNLSNFDMVYADLGNGVLSTGKNNFSPVTVKPDDNPLFVRKLTIEQMKSLSNYWNNFSSNSTWVVNAQSGYPYPQLVANPHKTSNN